MDAHPRLSGPVLARTAIATPVGQLVAVADADGLVALLWPDEGEAQRVPLPPAQDDPAHPVLRAAAAQLDEYFAGRRRDFDLPLAPRGTAFQRAVWAALVAIPYGETRSYGALAAALDLPGGARAVGAANGRNPISIVVPCHRVIGSGGALTGFAGGLTVKQRLLEHERGQGGFGF